MTEQAAEPIPHPLADRAGPGHVEVETRAATVFLGSALADLLRRAGAEGRRVVIVSDELSGLTQPLVQALKERDGGWVVRAPGGELRDGFSGRRVGSVVEVLDRRPWRGEDLAVRHLRPAQADRLELVAIASVRHRPTLDARLGGAAELMALRLQGDAPAAWDVLEPVAEEWDRSALTDWARSRMPDESRILVRGLRTRPFLATIDVARVAKGVQETTRAFAIAGPLGSPDADAAVAEVPSLLADLGEQSQPLIGLVMARPRRADQLDWPVLFPPPSPVALMIGPAGVAMLDLDLARAASEHGAVVVGRPRIPGVLYTFGPPGREAVERLTAVVESLDQAVLREAFGGPPTLPWEEVR